MSTVSKHEQLQLPSLPRIVNFIVQNAEYEKGGCLIASVYGPLCTEYYTSIVPPETTKRHILYMPLIQFPIILHACEANPKPTHYNIFQKCTRA